jgi:hypothetical protein
LSTNEYEEGGLKTALMEEIIEAMKRKADALRIELKDALGLAYGARINWPQSARDALGEDPHE